MTPSRTIWQLIADLLAEDANTFADPVDAMKVALVASNFVPSLDLTIGSLTLASFTGSTAKLAGVGDQTVYNDPVTGNRILQIKEPAGGWTWLCTATPTPAQVIYGFILTDNAGTVLYGSQVLPNPITIDVAGQAVTVGAINLQFPTTSPS